MRVCTLPYTNSIRALKQEALSKMAVFLQTETVYNSTSTICHPSWFLVFYARMLFKILVIYKSFTYLLTNNTFPASITSSRSIHRAMWPNVTRRSRLAHPWSYSSMIPVRVTWRSQGNGPTAASEPSRSVTAGSLWDCCPCPCSADPTHSRSASACTQSVSTNPE